jgi:hypothetical protein
VTQGRRAKRRDPDYAYGRAENFPETIRIKEAIPTCEVFLGSDQGLRSQIG